MVEIAALSFDEEALSWFLVMEDLMAISGWSQIKQMIYHQFRTNHEGDSIQQCLSIQLKGTVVEYGLKFYDRVVACKGISLEILIGMFVKGLQPQICSELMVLNHRGLNEIINTTLHTKHMNKKMRGVKVSKEYLTSSN